MDNKGINLRAFLSNAGTDEELRRLIAHFADTAKEISYRLREPLRGELGTKNVFGEIQAELDVWADNRIVRRLSEETTFGVKEIASEEGGEIIDLKTRCKVGGRYSVTIDPLDGSSLIDSNQSIGTIFGIHEGGILDGRSAREKMAAAMYFLYGPSTTMMIATKDKGTHEFLLNKVGNWVLNTPDIKVNDKGKIHSSGGLECKWTKLHRAFIEELRLSEYKARYTGALVTDVNGLLIKGGGIFSYPALNDVPSGKLRLLFEEQPMALLGENARGMATNGIENILDMVPKKLDQRSPIYIGSKTEVELAKRYLGRQLT